MFVLCCTPPAIPNTYLLIRLFSSLILLLLKPNLIPDNNEPNTQILASLSSGADDDITTDVNVRLTTSKELVALSIGLPATLFTMLLIPHYSTKFIQIIGFGLIALFFVRIYFCIFGLWTFVLL
jgi:hypothetical protein